jgi:OHCU decarboxylase
MAGRRPYSNEMALTAAAKNVWKSLDREDWLEAFAAHPKIGEKSPDPVAAREQAGVANAKSTVLTDLAIGNRKYEEKFGFIFIICASGRSADEMLKELNGRLQNGAERELKIAAAEQLKIMLLRLEKME